MRIRFRNKLLLIDETMPLLMRPEPLPGEVLTPTLRQTLTRNARKWERNRLIDAVRAAFPSLASDVQAEMALRRPSQTESDEAPHGMLELGGRALPVLSKQALRALSIPSASIEPTRSAFTLPPSPFHFSINFPAMYMGSGSTRSGGLGAPAVCEDAEWIGATRLRQLGATDLSWKFVSSFTSTTSTIAAAEVPLDPVAFLNSTQTAALEARYVELLTEAHLRGCKVVCTLMFTPEADDTPLPHPSTLDNTVVQNTSYYFTKSDKGSANSSPGVSYSSMSDWKELPWSADHVGESCVYSGRKGLIADKYGFGNRNYGFPTERTSGNPNTFHFKAMDPTCKYKQEHFGKVVEAIMGVMDRVEAALNLSGLSMVDIIEGFEVGNELSAKCAFVEDLKVGLTQAKALRTTGRFWGQTHFWAAYGLRLGLKNSTYLSTWTPPIFAAGLLAYNNQSLGAFSYENRTLAFAKGFLLGVVEEAQDLINHDPSIFAVAFTIEEPYTGSYEYQMSEMLHGIDYHWYHLADGDDLHIAYLVHELIELRGLPQAMQDEELDGIKTDIDSVHALFWTVTNFESGSSTKSYGWELAATVKVDTDDTLFLYTLDDEQNGLVPSPQMLQAMDLWRRLAAALAGGALTAGWHTWMAGSNQTTENIFATLGLRVDFQDEGTPISYSEQRLVWFAYQRFVSLLGGALEARMVYPPTTSRTDLAAGLCDENFMGWVAVFTFTLGGTNPSKVPVSVVGKYATLVVAQPRPQRTGRCVNACTVVFSHTSSLVSAPKPNAVVYDTIPVPGALASPTAAGLPLRESAAGELPLDDWALEVLTESSTGGSKSIVTQTTLWYNLFGSDDPPLLVISDQPLTVEIIP